MWLMFVQETYKCMFTCAHELFPVVLRTSKVHFHFMLWSRNVVTWMQADSKATPQIKPVCQGKMYLSKSKTTHQKWNVC
jgi:hypothetical protein